MTPTLITGDTADEVYVSLLRAIYWRGEVVSPRSKVTRELRPAVVCLTDSLRNIVTHPLRNLNYQFMVAEWLWMASGLSDVETISFFNKNIAQFSDDGRTFYGAYGPRIVAQLRYVIGTLKLDKDSRQAVMLIWREAPATTRDVPCTLTLQFLLRGRKLELVATMRSSDAWLGFPYDLFNFTRLQAGIAAELSVDLGPATLVLGSSHLYAEHFNSARRLLDSSYGTAVRPFTIESPALPSFPVAGDWREAFEDLRLNAREFQFTDGVWEIYRRVLTYRNHRDIDRHDDVIYRLMRYIKEARRE